MAKDLKYGDLDIPGIAEDEPVFIIRARDELALEVLDDYIGRADDEGVEVEVCDGVRAAQRLMGIWQTRNGSRLPA